MTQEFQNRTECF